MPIQNVALKRVFSGDSPAGSARPGVNVWSPKLSLVTASDRRSANSPNLYVSAAG